MKAALLCVLVGLVAGCAYTPPQKGGSATVSAGAPAVARPAASVTTPATQPGDGVPVGLPSATITQPENPQGASGQAVSYESEQTTETPVDAVKRTVTEYPDGRRVTVEEPMPAGTRVTHRVRQNVEQNLGGSWKDTARELGAALGSFKGVQYVGCLVLVLGGLAFVHPVGRKLIGGKDAALVLAGAGAVMMFGPYFLVRYSNVFLVALLGFGLYWLVARLKYKEGLLDANGDGIDDRDQ